MNNKLHNQKSEVLKRAKEIKILLERDWIRESVFYKKGDKVGSDCPNCGRFFELNNSFHEC